MRPTDEGTSGAGARAGERALGGLRLTTRGDDALRRASRADDAASHQVRVRADREAHRRWEVAAENRVAASSMCAFDARWVLAVRASDLIEGGRAAVLRPESRRRLLSTARGLGMRPFDANLVLAIVQDAARQGRTPQDMETIDSLVRVGEPERHAGGGLWVAVLLVCSAVWAGALVWWLMG